MQNGVDADEEIVSDQQKAKNVLISKFCADVWNPKKFVEIVIALKELNLTTDDLRAVVDKTIRALKDLPFIDIPPIIYQLLSLVSLGEKADALRKICDFFTNLDEISPATSVTSVKEAEGTVFLHIMFAAKQNQDVGRVLIQIFKTNPQILLKPFNSALLLSLSEISRFKDQALDLFKTTLIASLKDKERRKSSVWIRSKIYTVVDGELIVKRLIEDCSCGWDYVLEGLLKLGFALLETHLPKVSTFGGKILSTGGSNVIAHNACRLGETIIIECFKQHHSIRASLIKQVLDAIFLQSSSALYFIEILAQFVTFSPIAVLECKEKILMHFEHLSLLPHNVAVPFVKVFMPLVKLKPDLRDKLVEMLKKAMFSKDLEARKTAVGGFLLFLRHFQIMNVFLTNSQSQSQSFPTFSSQTLSSANSDRQKAHYEKLCLEVVCCLRKAMSQQGHVRKMLYTGLYNSARRNRQILQPVMDLLIRQLDSYLETDDGKLPPVHLQKCVVGTKDGAVLMEPLGSLIQALSLCQSLVERQAEEVNGENELIVDLNVCENSKRILSILVKKLGRSELEDFALDKSADYSHDTATGRKNALLAAELLAMFEASLEFCWKNNDFNLERAELIGNFQQLHTKLVEVLREKCVLNTNKKVAPQKTTQTSFATKKVDASVMQLSSIFDFLSLLLCETKSSLQESLNLLRSKVEFMTWIFLLSHTKIRNFLTTDPKLETSKAFENLCKFAKLMINFYVYDDGDDDCIVPQMKRVRLSFLRENALEIYGTILEVVCLHYADDFEKFLDTQNIVSVSLNDNFVEKLYKYTRNFTTILKKRLSAGVIEDEDSDDKKNLKQILCLMRIIENLLKFLPYSTDKYEQQYNSLLVICETKKVEESTVAKPLWQLFFRMQLQTELMPKKLIVVAQNVRKMLANETENVEEPDSLYAAVGSKSANVVCQTLVAHLDTFVENNCYVICKLKLNLTADDIDEETREKVDAGCCEMFGLIIAVWEDILKANISLTLSDSIIRSLQKLYVALTSFIRYNLFIYQKQFGRHCSKLEKLTKKSLVHLTPDVYKFMTDVRTLEDEAAANKKKRAYNTVQAKTKVIREMKTMSSLIYAIENYERSLIQLGAKSKTNFMEGAKPSMNRDFKIDLTKVHKALEEAKDDNSTTQSTVPNETQATTQKSVGIKKRVAQKSPNEKQKSKSTDKRKTTTQKPTEEKSVKRKRTQ